MIKHVSLKGHEQEIDNVSVKLKQNTIMKGTLKLL